MLNYMNRDQCMSRFGGISEGTTVYSRDGEKLGKITNLWEDSFQIEKGFFFPQAFTARYDDIQDMKEGNLYLGLSKDDLQDWRSESYSGWSQTSGINEGSVSPIPRDEYRDRYSGIFGDQTRVQLAEEQLEAQKTVRQAGEVRVRKIVHTEFRHFTVPVMREEVRVERVPVSGDASVAGLKEGQKAFQEETVSVPVMEEEVTINKRPVVKEEVVVTKERIQEQRDVSGEVRREEVQIDDETKRKKAG